MKYRLFRLVRRPQNGPGRRYYRLVSYPCDIVDTTDAVAYATRRHYAAIYNIDSDTWHALNASALQCLEWHTQGKAGYVKIY